MSARPEWLACVCRHRGCFYMFAMTVASRASINLHKSAVLCDQPTKKTHIDESNLLHSLESFSSAPFCLISMIVLTDCSFSIHNLECSAFCFCRSPIVRTETAGLLRQKSIQHYGFDADSNGVPYDVVQPCGMLYSSSYSTACFRSSAHNM